MNRIFVFLLMITLTQMPGAKNIKSNLSDQNLLKAILLSENAFDNYFAEDNMAMSRFYNPFNDNRSEETGSIWMYTSSMEAVNAILNALESQKKSGNLDMYHTYFESFKQKLSKLYDNAEYYQGTFTLTSYTQTKEWTVYGVDRGNSPGKARVEGIYNVYDDQQWLVRELIEAYRLTHENKYLKKAEYLTSYILDGWDSHLDSEGNEFGGITWGPGYITKHACSNGPMVSPLVWLSKLYQDCSDSISYRYISGDNSRKEATMKKSDYYLKYAKSVYAWQKKYLLRDDGVYADMMGGCDPHCAITYETVKGEKYREHNQLKDPEGRAYSYNSGTMLSGAADLYNLTGISEYLTDLKKLSKASFKYFAKKDRTVPGYYTYNNKGFSNWFNDVLMRGYVDASPIIKETANYLDTFQQNLDYAYQHFLKRGILPADLLGGWNAEESENNVEAMFTFAFASEYATLARYKMNK